MPPHNKHFPESDISMIGEVFHDYNDQTKLKDIEETKNKKLEDEKVKREERIKRLEQELTLLKNID